MAIMTRPATTSPRPPGVPPGPSTFLRPAKLAPVSVTPAFYNSAPRAPRGPALDSDADLERPGVDEHGRELLALREAVDRAQVAEREAQVADARDVDLDARVDAEMPERRRDRAI